MEDLKSRLAERMQLATDGDQRIRSGRPELPSRHRLGAATEDRPGRPLRERRYSPQVCTGVKTRIPEGDPDPAKIRTSYVGRQNLTMRMGIRGDRRRITA